MKINKKSKVLILIFLIIIIFISIVGIMLYKQIKDSYVFKIRDAFIQTLNANSASFEFEYIHNEDKITAIGDIEYSLKDLTLLADVSSNKGELVIRVNKGDSEISYFLEKFNYWITFDVTDIANEILIFLENIEDNNVQESFPTQAILEFFEFDEKINIEKYPNNLSKKFLINFITKNFTEDILKYEEVSGETIKYIVRPNVYKFLKEFIEDSKLNPKNKNELLSDLKNNKDKLDKINLELSVSIDKKGYIKEISYIQNDNDKEISMKIILNNIN